MFVHPKRPLRLLRVELTGAPAGSVLRWCTRLCLGGGEERQMIRTWEENGVFCARRADGPCGTVRFGADVPWRSACGVWADWISRSGTSRTGAGMDACAGFVFPAGSVTLAVGGEDEVSLKNAAGESAALLEETKAHWAEFTGQLCLATGSGRLDRYLNGWALYQIAACRMEGRASMYQCGGAFGFRDQLQDACGLISWAPETAKRHILYAASRQFREGDVLHWWHEDAAGPRGVRTRISDDLLWLPYVLCRYGEMTGDWGIFRKTAPYLSAPPLGPEENERYAPVQEGQGGTLLDHARRAVLLVLRRGRGPHGLLRMGGGDWNDGMNAVDGESTWLTWFAVTVLEKLGNALLRFGMTEERAMLSKAADRLREAAEQTWTGDRYLRGYYADGTPLGAPGNGECEIDSIAQSFAVFAGADPVRCEQALKTADRLLHTPENRLVRLLTPPFDGGRQRPGYIRSYAPGFRENGGQYTHAAIWLSMAMLRAGMKESAWGILRDILPGEREKGIYRAEPFVLAADICAAPESPGRAGWTWYTGAAGWYLQAAMELLGIRLQEGRLAVEPQLPEEMRGYRARLRLSGREYRIRVEKKANSQ